MMRLHGLVCSSLSAAIVVLGVGACSPPAAGGGAGNGASNGGGSGGPDKGGGGGPGGGGNVPPGPPAPKSDCAPSNVKLGVPASTPYKKDAYVKTLDGADFNRDTKTDIVALETDGVEIFLGKGDGTFAPGLFYAVHSGNNGDVIAADFTGDGIPDVLLNAFKDGESVDNAMGLLVGKGDGTLGLPTWIDAGAESTIRMRAADMNNDGKLDFAFASNKVGPAMLLSTGNGSFGSPVALDIPAGAAMWDLGDLNDDGAADLIYAQELSPTGICVLKNDGNGHLAKTPACFPAAFGNGQTLEVPFVGDVNGDGKLDVVGDSLYNDANGMAVFLGKGDGTFSDRKLGSFPSFKDGMRLVDVNNDGKADIVALTAQFGGGNPSSKILLSNGDGTFGDPLEYGAGAPHAAMRPVVGDFAGNGLRGIAVPNVAKGTIEVLPATCSK